MKVDETKSNNLKFGTKANTYKDIGIDLCKTKGGWGWSIWFGDESHFVAWSCNTKPKGGL